MTTLAGQRQFVQDALARLKDKWQYRNARIIEDRKMRELDPDVSFMPKSLDPGVQLVINNRPKTFWNWCVATLSNEPFYYRLPPKVIGGEDKASRLERFAYGISEQIDERLLRTLGERWSYLLAQQIVSGWYSFFPDVVKRKDGYLFTMEFWDPSTVFQEVGPDGLQIVIRHYRTTLGDAQNHVTRNGGSRINLGGDSKQATEITDCWWMDGDTVLNAYLVGGKSIDGKYQAGDMALDAQPQDNMESIPILTGPVGGRGNETWEGDNKRQVENMGTSVLDEIREEIKSYNTWLSMEREHARQTFNAHILGYGRGEPPLEEGDIQPGKSTIIPLDPDQVQDVKYLSVPPIAPEVITEERRIWERIEEGTVPTAVLGGSNNPQFSSGVLEASLKFQAKVRLEPKNIVYIHTSERAIIQMARKFKRMKGHIHLLGTHLQRMGLDGHFEEDFSYQDIPDNFASLTIYHKLSQLVDENMQADLGTKLIGAGIWSVREGMEQQGVPDPDAMMQQKAMETARRSDRIVQAEVAVQVTRILAELKERVVQAKKDGRIRDAVDREVELRLFQEPLSSGQAPELPAGNEQPALPAPGGAQTNQSEPLQAVVNQAGGPKPRGGRPPGSRVPARKK